MLVIMVLFCECALLFLVCSFQVFDSPHLKVMVGKRIRKRLDVKSIVQLIRSFDAPIGM